MTSNLANDEIADHALQLRYEAERDAKHQQSGSFISPSIFIILIYLTSMIQKAVKFQNYPSLESLRIG